MQTAPPPPQGVHLLSLTAMSPWKEEITQVILHHCKQLNVQLTIIGDVILRQFVEVSGRRPEEFCGRCIGEVGRRCLGWVSRCHHREVRGYFLGKFSGRHLGEVGERQFEEVCGKRLGEVDGHHLRKVSVRCLQGTLRALYLGRQLETT